LALCSDDVIIIIFELLEKAFSESRAAPAVNAGRNWKSHFGQEYRRIAERCVYLEASSTEQAAELAKAVVQAVYPEANAFEGL
jgi:hypothetical protein